MSAGETTAAGGGLSARARRVIDALEGINEPDAEAARRAAEIYDEEVVFSDPVQTCHGKAAVLDMTRRYRQRARELRFEIDRESVVESGDHLYFTWTGTFAGKVGPRVRVEGATRIVLRDGRILQHRDYFDVLGGVLGSMPGVAAAYRRLVHLVG